MSNVLPIDVAQYIIDFFKKANKDITTIKLQKLVFYSQVWSLVWDDEPLFDEDFEAWVNGPVVVSLFHKLKGFYFCPSEVVSANIERLSSNQKDTIDYMLPGIFGYGFDFGYLGLVGLIVFVLGTIIIGLKILTMYREKRENNNKKYLGREVLLTGALTAFIAQALIGMFIFNRSINGLALLSFIFLGALILANVVTLKSRTNKNI